jgi:large subunit ribosomal protein L21
MYAVIETGGKQYRVEVGTELEVELLDANAGDAVNLERVLLVADGDTAAIGRPLVVNASVAAEVVRRDRGEKLISFKYRPKARRRVKKGHRQELTILRISDIVLDGKSAAGEKAEVEKAHRAEREKLEATARRQAAADAALAAKLAADRSAEKAATEKKAASEKKAATEKKAAAGDKAATAAKTSGTTNAAGAKAAAKPAAKPAASKPAAKASTAKTSTPKAAATKPAAKASAKPAAAKASAKPAAAKPAAKPSRTAKKDT